MAEESNSTLSGIYRYHGEKKAGSKIEKYIILGHMLFLIYLFFSIETALCH